MRAKVLAAVLLLIGALPLPLYPFVLMSQLMHVAHAGFGQMTAPSVLFLAGGAFYPLVYLVALAGAVWHLVKGRPRAALAWSGVPIALLAIVAIAFGLTRELPDDDDRGPTIQVQAPVRPSSFGVAELFRPT